MKYVKVDDENEEPTAIVVAFANRDEEVGTRFVHEKIMAEYDSVLLCDLSNDSVREIVPSQSLRFNSDVERYSCSYRALKMATLVDS
jgi:hypothetical protein